MAVVAGMNLPLVGVDDANILFVYSKHLADGHGLVYNIGSERVEGFSSLLWMLMAAGGFAIFDEPAGLLFAVNILLVGTAMAYGWRIVNKLTASEMVRPVFMPTTLTLIWLTWTLANPDFFIWTTTSLMETGLWSALLLVTCLFMLSLIKRQFIGDSALAVYAGFNSLLLLTRPESMAWALYFMTMLGIILRTKGMPWSTALRRWLPVAASAAITLALLVAFRLYYFGYPLPNTYYAKMAPDRLYEIGWGLVYLREFVIANPLAGILILLASCEFVRLTPAILRGVFGNQPPAANILIRFAAASTALAGTLIPVLMGGDIFGAFRFFQPVWPILILPALLLPGVQRLSQLNTRAYVLFGVTSLCVFTLAQTNRWTNLADDRERVAHLYELTKRGILTGQYIQEIFPAESVAELPSLGASAAGGYKMGYPGMVIDTMGLNFTPMAHHEGDKRGTRGHAAFSPGVFWDYAPDLVEPTLCPTNGEPVNRANDQGNWLFQIYREIFVTQRFVDNYAYVAVQAPLSKGWLCTYMNRELVAQLEASDRVTFKPAGD